MKNERATCNTTFWDPHGKRRICTMPLGHADHWDEETRPAKAKVQPGGLTHDELVVACKNIGWDLTCGSCASVFFTGASISACESGCTSAARGS